MRYILLIFMLLTYCGFITFAQESNQVKGDLIVRFHDDIDAEKACEEISLEAEAGLIPEKQISTNLNAWLCHFDPQNISGEDMLDYARLSKKVMSAQFNYYLEEYGVPNDPNFGMQWQWQNTGQTGGTPDADIDAELAWDKTTGGFTTLGDQIVVAAVGDGPDHDHTDMGNNFWVNEDEIPDNGVDDDSDGYVDDYYGWNVVYNNDSVNHNNAHATGIAGMIGAQGNNSIGISGINWDIKIMLPVIESFGPPVASEVIDAYDYALTQRKLYNQTGSQGAFVVAATISVGVDGDPSNFPVWCDMYDSLGVNGIISSMAIPNVNNRNVDQNTFIPGNCQSQYTLVTTSTDDNDNRQSAYGPRTVDIATPGYQVYTLYPNSGYGTRIGSSYAAPTVAGLVGLLYSVDCGNLFNLTHEEKALVVQDAIFNSVDELPNLQDYIKYEGRINADSAVVYLDDTCSLLLPVKFHEFTGEQRKGQHHLHWTTTLEINNSHFEIQRSQNAEDWQTIGRVEGQERSTATLSYSYIDKDPLFGENYYRLKQLDLDGATKYSEVILLNKDGEPEKVTVYPNPSDGKLQFIFSEKSIGEDYNVTLINTLSKETRDYNLSDQETTVEVPEGIYFYHIMNEKGQQIKKGKVIVQ